MRRFLIVFVLLGLILFSPATVSAYYTNMPANVVVGQTDFISNTADVTQNKFGTVEYAFVDPGGRMIIADETNNRVLIWNSIPTTNGANADLVLGQPDFISSTSNNGGRSASSLSNPISTWSDGTRLIVSDNLNSRILIWNTFPTRNQQAADVVVGQSDMSSANSVCDAVHLFAPSGVWVYQNKLVISDTSHNRILIYNSIPTTNGITPDILLGQINISTCTTPSSPLQSNLNLPRFPMVDTKGRLVVSDRGQNRVLIWNSVPVTNNQNPDVVVGQNDFVSKLTPNPGVNTVKIPFAYSNGNRLFIADVQNNRLLIYNAIPTSNGASADLVLGQQDFNSNTSFSISSTSLNARSPYEYGNQLVVPDNTSGHRILIFPNTITTPTISLTTPPISIGNGRYRLTGSVIMNNNGGTYSLQTLMADLNVVLDMET